MVDELTRPLGLDPRPLPRRRLFAAILTPAAAVAGAVSLWLILGIEHPSRSIIAGPATTDPVETASIAGDGGRVPAAIEEPAGGLTELTAAPAGLAPVAGEVRITDPSRPRPLRLAAAPREDLVETGPYGLLPRIAEDGTTPLEAYARPAAEARGLKRVAIVIGGVGLAGTADAAARLPGEVTLALAPYGDNLPQFVARAREAGHELLLQLPLEPFNYPDIDPGPHTLVTGADVAATIDDLHWLLSRATTYVGVVNHLGARFTAEPEALAPVIAETTARGLLWVDDGSSARSRAGTVAGAAGAPFVAADLVLDADTTPEAIDAQLNRLVAIAAARGHAVATATAFPETIERVAAFAKDAARRGVVIVPISDLARRSRS
jgi:polysaccharide deacetylase 2 family uncharacterized protein YibQ